LGLQICNIEEFTRTYAVDEYLTDKRIEMMKSLISLLVLFFITGSAVYADQNSEKLDALFDTLLNSETTPSQASVVTSEIWQQWLKTDNSDAQKLMSLGIDKMNAYALDDAVRVFSAIIEIEPEFAEAWNKRATAYYMMEKFALSTADVAETIRLEPRHFGALSGQGLIYLKTNRRQAAVEWFKKALKVNPFMDNIRSSIEQLEQELKANII
jgi:tetratricopeptide (TPR) repeat protein